MFAAIAFAITRSIGFTVRLRVVGEEKIAKCPGGKIIAGWHGRTLLAALYFRRRKWWALISHSRDGEMQNTIFNWLGFRTVRGSTGRGGARAAVECARILRAGDTFVYTPDGPRGPSQKVQRGILWLAQKGKASIIPAAASARPRKLFRSWDQYLLPLPFCRGIIVIGDPIRIDPDADEAAVEQIGIELERELNRLQDLAEAEMGFRG